MKRSPIYVFDDRNSIGIYNVPLQSSVQINRIDNTEIPKTFKLKAKVGVISNTTIGEFLDLRDSNGDQINYIDLNEATEIPSELELIKENNQYGWRLLKPDNGIPQGVHRSIGMHAIDLIHTDWNDVGTIPHGASGHYSLATGFQTQASGNSSTSFGIETRAINKAGFVCGLYNKGQSTENLIEIGCGTSINTRLNALEITKSGMISAPTMDISLLNSAQGSTLVTKEYSDAGISAKYDKSGGPILGDVVIMGNTSLTDAFTNNGTSLFKKEVVLNSTIKVGKDPAQNSTILFTDTGTASPALYWNNSQNDFYVDNHVQRGFKVWHSGNHGLNSTLDAGYLGGTKWDQYTTNNELQNGLDQKYNKTGGQISGEVTITADLNTTGISNLYKLRVGSTSNFTGLSTFNDNAIFNDRVDFNNQVHMDTVNSLCTFKMKTTYEGLIDSKVGILTDGLYIRNDIDGNSGIQFGDFDELVNPQKPEIFWSSTHKAFMLNTSSNAPDDGPFKIWHEGNFNASNNVSRFLDLSDTPAAAAFPNPPYAGQYGKTLKVNAAEDALIFASGNTSSATWGFIDGNIQEQDNDLWPILEDCVKLTSLGTQAISGSIGIGTDLTVGNNIITSGDIDISGTLTVSDVIGHVTFSSSIKANAGILGNTFIEAKSYFKVGTQITNVEGIPINNSRVEFTGPAGTITQPAIFYDFVSQSFKISDNSGDNRTIQLQSTGGPEYAELTSDNIFAGINTFQNNVVIESTGDLNVQTQFITIGDHSAAPSVNSGIQTEYIEYISGSPDIYNRTGIFPNITYDCSSNQWSVQGILLDSEGEPILDGGGNFQLHQISRIWTNSNFMPSTKLDAVQPIEDTPVVFTGDLRIEADPIDPIHKGSGDLYIEGNLDIQGTLTCSNTSVDDLEVAGDVDFTGTSSGSQTFTIHSNVETTDIQSDTLIIQAGDINFSNLPTTDPGVPGQLWDDIGTLKISQ